MGKSLGWERNFENVCLSLEQNIGREDEFWVSGGSGIPEAWTDDRESPFAK